MSDQATTERYEAVTAIKEYGDGTPWIMFQPRTEERPTFMGPHDFIGLDLEEGVTFEQAQELSDKLRTMVRSVSITRFHR